MKTYSKNMKIIGLILFSIFLYTCEDEIIDVPLDSIQDEVTVVGKKGLDNRSTVEWDVEWTYWLDVECGDWTDSLSGPVTAHVVSHYKNGEIISTIFHTTGLVESANTDEVFIVNEVSKDNFLADYIDFHFNIRGNMGSHYRGTMTWDYVPGDWDTGIMITRRFVCPGSKRNDH